jgi:hypothetical protein
MLALMKLTDITLKDKRASAEEDKVIQKGSSKVLS